jgi:hypothetical protein
VGTQGRPPARLPTCAGALKPHLAAAHSVPRAALVALASRGHGAVGAAQEVHAAAGAAPLRDVACRRVGGEWGRQPGERGCWRPAASVLRPCCRGGGICCQPCTPRGTNRCRWCGVAGSTAPPAVRPPPHHAPAPPRTPGSGRRTRGGCPGRPGPRATSCGAGGAGQAADAW